MEAGLNVSKEVQHELDGLVETITFMRILHAIVEVQQQEEDRRSATTGGMHECVLMWILSRSGRILSYFPMLALQAEDV